jgi:hypothetical protein
MYPISLVLDSLRNEARRFHTTFEVATESGPEPSGEAIPVVKTKIARYIKTTLALLGVGLLSVAAFHGLGPTDAVTSTESGPETLNCQYMTVYLQGGRLIPGGKVAYPAANIRCTTAMFQTSQPCRDMCSSSVP